MSILCFHKVLWYNCLQAAILAMFLPETKKKSTLETLDDMLHENTKEVKSIALIDKTDFYVNPPKLVNNV